MKLGEKIYKTRDAVPFLCSSLQTGSQPHIQPEEPARRNKDKHQAQCVHHAIGPIPLKGERGQAHIKVDRLQETN